MANEIASAPRLSIIIPVYNDWRPLLECLKSLQQQVSAPQFEVILVDDGSEQAAPSALIQQSERPYPVDFIRQVHVGVAAARNAGIKHSTGSVILFTDADCRLAGDCLSNLAAKVTSFPQHDCFQLHLTGECSNVAGRAEELRLRTLQKSRLQPDGRIQYLNTAGFAIRRERIDVEKGLFNPGALRSEDTLLMAEFMQRGELPFFVQDALVYHRIVFPVVGCFRKDLRTGWLEAKSEQAMNASGARIRMSDLQRFQTLMGMWRTAGEDSIGRAAWFLLLARRLVRRVGFGLSTLSS